MSIAKSPNRSITSFGSPGDIVDQVQEVRAGPGVRLEPDLHGRRRVASDLALRLQRAQALFFFLQLLDPPLARAIQAALLDERDDLVQLAGVEERAVRAAHVDDGSRQLAEVH